VALTFLGDFRGWRIVPGWKDPHEGHGHDHAHDHGDKPMDGPVPHESPWPMTAPLVILSALAIGAGFLNAGPLKIEVMRHWLNRGMGFARVDTAHESSAVKTILKEGTAEFTHLEHYLLIPGVLAFLIGVGGAYYIYVVKKGEPARKLIESAGGLHRLVYDKWRIDELYEATVIAALDSLAETAALFDKWVIDGILARLTVVVVQSFGWLFSAFQTGRVQVYAAVMVVGLVATGAFFAVPHGEMVVTVDKQSGQYIVEAAPGLGYKYRWDRDGDGTWDNGEGKQDEAWTLLRKVQVEVQPGESRKVRLGVQNVFKLNVVEELELRRPKPDMSVPEAVGLNLGAGQPAEVK
jgi:NADH-quinone oxidoreductase subunit L